MIMINLFTLIIYMCLSFSFLVASLITDLISLAEGKVSVIDVM